VFERAVGEDGMFWNKSDTALPLYDKVGLIDDVFVLLEPITVSLEE
jgi:hypothetical protein